ncbi:MAG: hypothetical protein WCB68_11115 [Pyrinomonadaceae bacterium]
MAKTSEEKIQRLSAGGWGGQHVGLEVTTDGATLDFDCAHGEINQAIVLDSDGRFNVQGTYTIEGPGPIRAGKNYSSSARYSGSVSGDTMTLSVAPANSTAENITFTLTRGKAGRVWKCK